MLDFALVKEALEERGLLLTRLAPHLVRPVPFLYPLTHAWERPYVGAGLALYDAHGDGRQVRQGVPKHKHLSRKQPPGWPPTSGPTPCTARSATTTPGRRRPARDGARPHRRRLRRPVANRAMSSASCARASGSPASGRATSSASATSRSGPRWSSTRRGLDRRHSGPGRRARPVPCRASKGIHLVVPRDRIHSRPRLHHCAPRSPCCSSSRGAGTGSSAPPTPPGPSTRPTPRRADRHRLPPRPRQPPAQDPLTTATSRASTPGCGRCSPVRGEHGETTKLSREHAVAHPAPGLVVVAGGKYTTYRVMARDAVDRR